MKNVRNNSATVDVVLPLGSPFYICVKQAVYGEEGSNLLLFKHQGTESWKTVSIIKCNKTNTINIITYTILLKKFIKNIHYYRYIHMKNSYPFGLVF